MNAFARIAAESIQVLLMIINHQREHTYHLANASIEILLVHERLVPDYLMAE
ncbi:MAG TPA: hypothetical protein TECP_00640 [Hyphomicrobiaceae bacterium MAG_BT-2024]